MSNSEQLNPKSRGLGRGLGALFSDDEPNYTQIDPEAHTPGAQRKIVGIEQLEPNPDQPRHHFDEEALNNLAASIKEHGLLQPILVRPHKHNEDMFEIVAGERRWRASQIAQLHEVPIIIRDLDDSATLQIALIENLQRQDLNPIEEAKGYQRLMDEFGHTQESVSEVLGKSRSHVANMVRLLHLPGSVQTMVSKGDITAGHARALVKADNPTLLAQEIASKGLSVRQAERLVSEAASSSKTGGSGGGGSSRPAKDADTMALENELSNALGMKVILEMKDEHAGTLSVNFRNLDQLDLVLQRLSQSPIKTH